MTTSFARQLASAPSDTHSALLADHPAAEAIPLAHALHALYLERIGNDAAQALGAVTALRALADSSRDDEVTAYAVWTEGLSALQLERQLERTIARVDEAAARFEALGKSALVPQTQVSKVVALAILGRYDEATACGEEVKRRFDAAGDDLGAGKIELNLGNLYHRRGELQDAEALYRAARTRFLGLGDDRHTAMAENGLANVLTLNHHFQDAMVLYEHALLCADKAGMESTQASIETNIGILAMARGQYDVALDALERSRRRFAHLGMAQNALAAQSELADAYLELNLIPEAVAIYEEVIPQYRSSGMQAELAHALLHHARATLNSESPRRAKSLLSEARLLYEAEGNPLGIANVALLRAQRHLLRAEGSYKTAARAADLAATIFAEKRVWSGQLLAQWLMGESLRLQSRASRATAVLTDTLHAAESQSVPQIAQRCHTSLGLLAQAKGDAATAATHFHAALELTESLRAPLPADTFRTAFVADKMTPYTELVRLYLETGDVAAAFVTAERARARALSELLGAPETVEDAQDDFERDLLQQRTTLREELNWYYSQLGRRVPTLAPNEDIGAAIQQRETAVQAIERQLRQTAPAATRPFSAAVPNMTEVQADLPRHAVLVSYYLLGTEWVAFVVTNDDIAVVRDLGDPTLLDTALQRLRFQVETMRYGQASLQGHEELLLKRTRHYLGALYDYLLRPLEDYLERAAQVIIVPHGALHYVPFHALYDGSDYAIERWEVSYVPSTAVLRYCLAPAAPTWHEALLVGVPDDDAPRVRDEVLALAPLFPHSKTLLAEEATFHALRNHTATADVLHLACHGQFRPDNPLFSALRLGDGWMNVYDTYRLRLNGSLVTLSACETGVNEVAPGDELLGLARGLFSAGALSLVVSLWTVDDAATATLMTLFYEELLGGASPAAALRYAQLSVMETHPHPFYWSPFVLMGRY